MLLDRLRHRVLKGADLLDAGLQVSEDGELGVQQTLGLADGNKQVDPLALVLDPGLGDVLAEPVQDGRGGLGAGGHELGELVALEVLAIQDVLRVGDIVQGLLELGRVGLVEGDAQLHRLRRVGVAELLPAGGHRGQGLDDDVLALGQTREGGEDERVPHLFAFSGG